MIQTTIANPIGCVIEDKTLPDKKNYIITIGNMDLIPYNIVLSAIELSREGL
ncbi:hypothetical protein [Anaeromicropila populeti]|uniref:Chromosome partitioning protein n=1 Tax=Anaeromicropila populeti TaxID=37658 RepID=A0A1I6IPY8_9FIRM|nr:hypothetical protein [Anaeromicropila populeti]SFR68310.1 chromosome partitioning protein [Anaeromicropila populeti]